MTSVYSGRGAEDAAEQMLRALKALRPPARDGFLWVAAEAAVARALCRSIVDTLNHPAEWVKAAGD